MKNKWLYIGIGAVILYLFWKKFDSSTENIETDVDMELETEPIILDEDAINSDVSQGDVVNELAFASGVRASISSTPKGMGSVPCFCNGTFLGYTNKRNCRKMCKKAVKFDTL